MLHISPRSEATSVLSIPSRILLHSKYFKVAQGRVASSAPANARSLSDSWISCLILAFEVRF